MARPNKIRCSTTKTGSNTVLGGTVKKGHEPYTEYFFCTSQGLASNTQGLPLKAFSLSAWQVPTIDFFHPLVARQNRHHPPWPVVPLLQNATQISDWPCVTPIQRPVPSVD